MSPALPEMMAPRVGVAVLLLNQGRVLLLKRRNVHGEGSWSTPGGHLEPGEDPAQCAARETLEEVGVQVTGLRFLAVTNDLFPERGLHYITLWMQAEPVAGEPCIAAPDEVAEVRWFAWDALPQPLFTPFANLLAGRSLPPGALEALRASGGED